jgi:hypothetical protein
VFEVEELPRKRATIMMMNTAAPATHTHGDAYQLVVVVVVVLFSVTLSFVACAHTTICIHVNMAIIKNF